MSATMKAAVIVSPGNTELATVPVPEPGTGDTENRKVSPL